MTAGKLTVDADGRVTGPADITYNTPWPTENGTAGGGSPSMMGVVMHTEDGFEQGTIATFNTPKSDASAFFSVGLDGHIHQYGPVGKDWEAWAQEAGNPMWYSIEHADNRNPATPLTDAQLTASAQLVECLSAFAGFPLQVSDSTAVKGYGIHSMGGVPWGNHPGCPGPVRSAQRAEIIARAHAIRNPPPPKPPVPPPAPKPVGVKTELEALIAQMAAVVAKLPD